MTYVLYFGIRRISMPDLVHTQAEFVFTSSKGHKINIIWKYTVVCECSIRLHTKKSDVFTLVLHMQYASSVHEAVLYLTAMLSCCLSYRTLCLRISFRMFGWLCKICSVILVFKMMLKEHIFSLTLEVYDGKEWYVWRVLISICCELGFLLWASVVGYGYPNFSIKCKSSWK